MGRRLALNSKQGGELAFLLLVVPFFVCPLLDELFFGAGWLFWWFPRLVPLLSLVAIIAGHAAHARLTEGDPPEAHRWSTRGLVMGYFTLALSAVMLALRRWI